MSWWVMLLKAPADCANAGDMGRDHVVEPLGSRAQVIAALSELYPAFDPTKPGAHNSRILPLDDEGTEVHLPEEDPLVTLSIRPGDMEPIWRLCDRLGARLMDTGSGDFLGRDEGDAGGGS